MQPLADIFCCCKNAATDPVEQKKKKTTFPEIVIQEPTPMVLRKESEVVEGKETKEESVETEEPATAASEQETVEKAVEGADVVDTTPRKKKSESIRKKSIPLLDQEHRMSLVLEACEAELPVAEPQTVINTEVLSKSTAEAESSSVVSAASPAAPASPAPPPANPSLQPEVRKGSTVSSSSDWSWPSEHGQTKIRQDAQPGALGLPEGTSRRISTLAPAQVDSPLATKVDKFTMIPHPGK